MRKNIHRQFLGFLCAVMCACSVAVPCFAADVAASDPEISFYMEKYKRRSVCSDGSEWESVSQCQCDWPPGSRAVQDRAGDSEKAGQPVDHR